MSTPKQTRRPKGRPAKVLERRKVTMRLTVETAKKLLHESIELGIEIGQIAEPVLAAALAKKYYVGGGPPPSTDAKPVDETSAAVVPAKLMLVDGSPFEPDDAVRSRGIIVTPESRAS